MAAVDETPCPMCGESIGTADRVCRFCGEPVPKTEESPDGILERLDREAEASAKAQRLFWTGVLGWVPIYFSFYGVRFLLAHREPFPRKWMAVTGTVIHCFWTLIWALLIGGGLLLAITAEYE